MDAAEPAPAPAPVAEVVSKAADAPVNEPSATTEASPAAPPSSAPPANGNGSVEAMTEEVKALKAVLDVASSSQEALLQALQSLREMGSLPTKVLSDTLIGKSVNQLAKASSMEPVKAKARELVEEWRQTHRKRKASAMSSGGDSVKRSASAASLDTGLSTQQSFDSPAALEKTVSEVTREDSLIMSQEDKAAPEKMTAQREKVRQKLLDAIGKEETIETKGEETGDQDRMKDPVTLAAEIEEALHSQLTEKDYFNQARAIIFNLKDKKNQSFRLKLLVGFYDKTQIPKLKAEDMASDEKNAERAKMRQYAMEEIQTDWALKHGQLRLTGMFTCGKCKGVKTTYFQMQTRSSDEPMTTFVTCLTCNNRWKFC